MQAPIAMAILETVHHLLQSHVDNRLGSDAMRTLIELLEQGLHGQSALHLSFGPGGVQCQGASLPDSSVNQELCRLFLREGFEDLVFLPVPNSEQVAVWVDILRSHYRRRVACDDERGLQPRLLASNFHHIKFGFSLTRKLQNQSGEFGPRLDPSSLDQDHGHGRMTWEEEGLLESCRELDVDFGLTLLEDLEKHPASELWQEQGMKILGDLLERLVAKGRYRACLPILDRALHSRILFIRERLEACLDSFRSTDRLGTFLRALSSSFDPALTDFLKRLGPGIAPFLLSEEDQYPSSALHSLLESFLKKDINPFLGLLDCGSSKVEHRALSYLLESGQALPVDLLERLTRSDTVWIQDRALQLLVAQHPTWLSEDRAMCMLEDDQPSTRIQALRRMRGPDHADQAEVIRLWFERRQRKMGFTERKEAFLTLVACLGNQALAYLQPYLDTDSNRRRRSDLDNMLCAILALGAVTDRKAHDMLVELSHSSEEAVHQMAAYVLAG